MNVLRARMIRAVEESLVTIHDEPNDYDRLLDAIGNRRIVLLGEASHGTHEFYRERARITRLLVERKGFHAVVAEADWPDAFRVNRYLMGAGDDRNANEALAGFRRFPAWMWRNTDMLDFVDWAKGSGIGFYGMDLYSLRTSIDEVVNYLDRVDPAAAARARRRYSCLDHIGEDGGFALTPECEEAIIGQLVELQARSASRVPADGVSGEEALFHARLNARLVKDAEQYYRASFRGSHSSWNLRDRHMVDTIHELLFFLGRRHTKPKLVVWAHNTHVGDARATQMGEEGEWNVGQLVREDFPRESFLVGFTTHAGTVTAATEWGGPAERKNVRPSHSESIERVFHETDAGNFFVLLQDSPAALALQTERLERAIGVIYRPEIERVSHYFRARLGAQFDAVVHLDETRALAPLEITSEREAGEDLRGISIATSSL